MSPFGTDDARFRESVSETAHIRPDLATCLIVRDGKRGYAVSLRVDGKVALFAITRLISDVQTLHGYIGAALGQHLPVVDASEYRYTAETLALAFGDRLIAIGIEGAAP